MVWVWLIHNATLEPNNYFQKSTHPRRSTNFKEEFYKEIIVVSKNFKKKEFSEKSKETFKPLLASRILNGYLQSPAIIIIIRGRQNHLQSRRTTHVFKSMQAKRVFAVLCDDGAVSCLPFIFSYLRIDKSVDRGSRHLLLSDFWHIYKET